MIVLGINHLPGSPNLPHDTSAAIIRDGEIIAAAEEERFNRIRHTRGTAKHALEYCLEATGITLKQVDAIAFANNPYALFRNWRVDHSPKSICKHIIIAANVEYYMRSFSRKAKAKIHLVDHHMAHAACGYLTSGMDKANVLTIDTRGESETFAFYEGREQNLKRIWDIPYAPTIGGSFGSCYQEITYLLELGKWGEGKTMGLAAYGKPEMDMSETLSVENHLRFKLNGIGMRSRFKNLKRLDSSAPLTQEHKNLAASVQLALENAVINLAKEAFNHTGIRNFVLSGGVALNCSLNTKLLEQDFCDRIYIPPAANDGGGPLGAALYLSTKLGTPIVSRPPTAYHGPSYDNHEIEEHLKKAKLKYQKLDHVEDSAAELITSGKIIGWFQGRMELGPRALGNRSILADPTISGINDKINREVKYRELWRPFGASIIQEKANEYFHGFEKCDESPFMLQTFQVKEPYHKSFPAIVHIDGRSRLQTVREQQNPRLYKLLKSIEKINAHPILLNTSFNRRNEPIVCSPSDAISCFFNSALDALVIGDFLIEK